MAGTRCNIEITAPACTMRGSAVGSDSVSTTLPVLFLLIGSDMGCESLSLVELSNTDDIRFMLGEELPLGMDIGLKGRYQVCIFFLQYITN